jgi:hypothetical protein
VGLALALPVASAAVLTPPARAWVAGHRAEIRAAAAAYGVDAVVLATVVAAEIDCRTAWDDVEEEYVRGLLQREGDAFFRDLAGMFRDPDAEAKSASGYQRLLYFCSLGPAQIQIRLALEVEDQVAKVRGRPPRALRPLLVALLDPRDCLDSAGAVVAKIVGAYRRIAGLDIARDAAIVATVYSLGSPESRARQYRDAPPGQRRLAPNEMGRHAQAIRDEVARLLDGR